MPGSGMTLVSKTLPVAAGIMSLVGMLGAQPEATREPTLTEVLARAASYVGEFERRLSEIIVEERYIQNAQTLARRGCPPGTPAGTYQATLGCEGQLANPMRTQLRSDLLLVRTAGAYVQYRDVFEVDNQRVRDREERLANLFDRSGQADEALKRRILDENARFNIGDVLRTINTPLVALQFLGRANQWRFKFKRTADRLARIGPHGDAPPDVFRVSTEVWTVEYREQEPATMIRTPAGLDLPSRGRFWIEPDTGRVLMTELIVNGRGLRTQVTVSFQSEPLRNMLVPIEMREHYESAAGSRIDCLASYGHFRSVR